MRVIHFIIMLVLMLPEPAFGEQKIRYSLDVSMNGLPADECITFISEQKADTPPDVPYESDGMIVITKNVQEYRIIIKCVKKNSLEDVLRILRMLSGD